MSIVTNDTVKLLDEHQIAVSEHYSAHPWLNNTEQLARTIDWITFFRRNEELFIEYYFGLPLYEYQRFVLHELGTHQHSTLGHGAGHLLKPIWRVPMRAPCVCFTPD